MKPRIYITHHVRDTMAEINDFVIAMLWHLETLTPEAHQTVLVVWHPEGEEHLGDWLKERLPPGVEYLFNDRSWRPDTLPSMRNKCVIDARERGADQPLVLLENDIRVTRDWLPTLLGDLEQAEQTRGRGNVVMTPRFAPYHYLPPQPGAPAREYLEYWTHLREHKNCLNAAEFGSWCRTHNIPSRDSEITSKQTGWLEGGNILMMFATRAGCFDRFGLCDEAMTGWGYDDDDWGLRAILAGVCNAQSQGAWIGHRVGLTFHHKKHGGGHGHGALGDNINNNAYFKEKWKDLLAETHNIPGALWEHIRHGQPKAKAPVGPWHDLHDAIEKAKEIDHA